MNHKATDIHPVQTELYFLPVKTRVPLKFGSETLEEVTCARVRVWVEDRRGQRAEGWGETPLSVQWVWPSPLPYAERLRALQDFCKLLAEEIARFKFSGHPLEVGIEFQEWVLPSLLSQINQQRPADAAIPWLAALVCLSAFDLALYDAFGQLHQRPVFDTFNAEFMNDDLADFLEPADTNISFAGKYPQDFLLPKRHDRMPAWHLVGGLDPLSEAELTGAEPRDGYPVLLEDWIKTDSLTCLKIKLRGNDARWDFERLAQVGRIGLANGIQALTADFNCTVQDPEYVNAILDRLKIEEPRCHTQILYVEQPFPYELENHRIDVRSVAARKPLFLDESAHDWRMVRLGRELGWTGVALKTCKTLSGAILAACWAQAHGMALMVQDLTNPMLAQIPHVLLAANINTIMGVETNAMQFYPEASRPEAVIHPGIYRRQRGEVDLSSIHGPGFGYRLKEIKRTLPEPAATFGC